MLTAALADALLILSAVLGVSALVLTVPWVKIALGVIGVCFLLYIGSIGPVRKWLNRVSAVIIWISAVYLAYNLTRVA